MSKFIDSKYVSEIGKITQELYRHGWDERNGGNVSYRILPSEINEFDDVSHVLRNIPISFEGSALAGQYFLVTGTGKYFKNVIDQPECDTGLVRIADNGKSVDLVWGFITGGSPTSEFPTHLMSHIERMVVNPNQRVIMHCHPTNLIGMSFTFPLNEKELTNTLWKMQTESLVVFPRGIGIIPWMVPGTDEIGFATAEKMKEYTAVIWPQHGIFASGSSIDEAYGLVETIEKACEIWTVVQAQGGQILNTISDQDLMDLGDTFHADYRKEFLNIPVTTK